MQRPHDGLITQGHTAGWLSRHWLASLKPIELKHGPQVARGRTLGRGGRVRELWTSPGLAGAEVVDREPAQASIRFHVLDDEQWELIQRRLLDDLSLIASLLEGDLPRTLLDALDETGVRLLPSWQRTWGSERDIESSCDCPAGWKQPCAHTAALYAVLADALEGDPFLLFTLRGRTRDQLLASLRTAWGDDPTWPRPAQDGEEPPPESDWFDAPVPLPDLKLRPGVATQPAAGLLALGPPPGGGEDLLRALTPLYEAGAEAALAVARHGDPEPTPEPAPVRAREHSPSSGGAAAAPS